MPIRVSKNKNNNNSHFTLIPARNIVLTIVILPAIVIVMTVVDSAP